MLKLSDTKAEQGESTSSWRSTVTEWSYTTLISHGGSDPETTLTKLGGMNDLTIAPGPGIPGGLVIVAADLTERFAKASGPGGQGVNTTDSKVQLSIDIAECASLSDAQRRRALHNLEHRLDGTVLTVSASTQRSQVRNRAEARERMATLLREALAPPPPSRRSTKPTRGSVRRRLEAKKRRSELKAMRRKPRLP